MGPGMELTTSISRQTTGAIYYVRIGRNNMEASFSGRNNETSHCPTGV